jgi:outer membrane protein, multidrug efflux system
MIKVFPLIISLLLLFTGCKVGPDYYPPEDVLPLSFSEDRFEESIPINDEDLIEWWRVFNDPFLNQLLEETMNGNFDYRIALQRVYQARAQYWVQFTEILPEFDFDFTASRARTSQSFPGLGTSSSSPSLSSNPSPSSESSNAAATSFPVVPPIQSFYQTGVDALWIIDLFGGLRRSADAAYDEWEATYEEARGVKILVLGETANTYVVICSLQKNVAIKEETVRLDEELVELAFFRFEAGLANEQEVEATRVQLYQDQAELLSLQIRLKQTIYSLAILVGKLPEILVADFEINRPIPRAEGLGPYTLPSDLLRRRPDIRTSERLLAAATEKIGVAVSNLFPQLSLVGSSSSFASNPLQGANVGFSSSTFNTLFKSRSLIWGIGGFLTSPVFDFGKRLSIVDVQVFLKNQAFLNYQQSVINALQETEQALAAYYREEERLQVFSGQVKSTRRIFDLTADQFQAGLVSYTEVLDAKEAWLKSVTNQANSQQALASDLIAIYLAIGGDW